MPSRYDSQYFGNERQAFLSIKFKVAVAVLGFTATATKYQSRFIT